MFEIFKKKTSVVVNDNEIIARENVIEIPKNTSKVQEKANKFFDTVYGLEPVKENLYRVLEGTKAISILLCGPPGCAKTLFASIVRKKCKDVLYFDAANGSGAGLIEALNNFKNAKVLIIDEADKLKKNEMNCLLGLLSNGTVDKILKEQKISFEIKNLKVIATTNSTTKLSPPIRSRFSLTYNIPAYTDEEFVQIAKFCLKGELPESTAELIANLLLENGIRDIRAVQNVSGLVQKQDTEEDIKRIINVNWIPFYTSEQVNYN